MSRFINQFICSTALSVLIAFPVFAAGKTWKVSLAQMTVYEENHDKGVLVDFVKALEKASGDRIEYQVVPFIRSMRAVENGDVDFHLPMIKIPELQVGTDKFDYSTETIFYVNFVLYSRKDLNITPATARNFKIETDAAHTSYFNFPIEPSYSIDSSLKKINMGRLQGFIFSDLATDPVIIQRKLNGLKRQFYQRFAVKIILPKGGRGGPTDKFLSETIVKMIKSGEMQRILAPVNMPYDNWQP